MSRGLRALKRIKIIMEEHFKHWKQDVGYIDEELKALETIKKKGVDVGWLMKTQTLSEYNNVIGTVSHKALSQEEYDLLKEVLL